MKYLFFLKINYIRLFFFFLQNCKHPCKGIWKRTPEVQGENTDSHQAGYKICSHKEPPLKKYNYSIWICNS